MPTEAYRIHGISGEFLKDKPLFSSVAEEFLDFIGTSKLVIHNAAFDVKFLNHELSLLSKPSIHISNTVDTLAIARKMFPGMKTNLDALCKRYKIDNSGRKLHGALKDAVLLAEVYVELSGGRQVSFNINSGKEVKTFDFGKKPNNPIDMKNIVVIKPTKEELENHKNFLSKITNPIWSM
jgi:DNA polymerase-3 subunit epsilon